MYCLVLEHANSDWHLVLEVPIAVQIIFLINVLLSVMNNSLIYSSAHEMLKAYK